MSADLLTPLAVYLRLSDGITNSFLLESVEGGKSVARYSFIGADPYRTSSEQGSLNDLKQFFRQQCAAADHDLPPFIGGAIGHLGFDCSEWFETSLAGRKESTPEAEFAYYRSIVAFDHAKQLIKIISLVFSEEAADDQELKSLFDAADRRNREIRHRLERGEANIPTERTADAETVLSSNWERTSFESAVRDIKELIRAGECYQVVLSQCFTRPTTASPIAIYRALRTLNPSPYMFLLDSGTRQVIGASPEMLVKCEGDRLEYRPIAGTRPRGRTVDEDDVLADEMRVNSKEVAEHLMLVDLGRNDLGRVAEFGSVRVDELMKVEKYSHVQHLVSSLSARLRPEFDRFDALASCFPAGTVSGAPKVRAIEIIRDLEPTGRGVYAGAVGYFDHSGNMDLCIAIRTLVLENGVAKIQAGAGIVADSDAASEFEETVNKARGLVRAIEIAEGSKY